MIKFISSNSKIDQSRSEKGLQNHFLKYVIQISQVEQGIGFIQKLNLTR